MFGVGCDVQKSKLPDYLVLIELGVAFTQAFTQKLKDDAVN